PFPYTTLFRSPEQPHGRGPPPLRELKRPDAEERRREQRACEVVHAERVSIPAASSAPGHRGRGGCERDEPSCPGVAPPAHEEACKAERDERRAEGEDGVHRG